MRGNPQKECRHLWTFPCSGGASNRRERQCHTHTPTLLFSQCNARLRCATLHFLIRNFNLFTWRCESMYYNLKLQLMLVAPAAPLSTHITNNWEREKKKEVVNMNLLSKNQKFLFLRAHCIAAAARAVKQHACHVNLQSFDVAYNTQELSTDICLCWKWV